MEHTRYSRIEPNSHSFISLDNIIMTYEYAPEELTQDYLLVGFNNTFTRGMTLQKVREVNGAQGPAFFTVIDIFEYLMADVWNLKDFIIRIENTIANGVDLKQTGKMERTQVYQEIDREREYQDLRWDNDQRADRVPDSEKAVAEWVSYMEQHLNDAKRGVYDLDKEEALAQIRKVVALGVRALEIHGCPERKIPTDLEN